VRILGWLLQRLYQEFAWAYDGVAWLVSLGRWTAWGEAVLPFLKGERVLEVGCGTGRLLARLMQDRQAWGIDPSSAMLRRARRRLRRQGLPRLCRACAQALPFPGGTFDTVVSVFPTAYLYDPACWAEFRRVLAPGGRVLVVHSVQPAGVVPLRLAARWLNGSSSGREFPTAAFRVSQLLLQQRGDQVQLYVAECGDGADVG
jgi:ubiquinone/menaquinone biosynthesis C-methylase UbiE